MRPGEIELRPHLIRIVGLIAALLLSVQAVAAAPQTVYFRSADGRTALTGYLFQPNTPGPWPAIVMLHGRGGPYSSNDNEDCTFVGAGTASPCNASTLSKRHAMWGEYWSARGYLALLPDSFGPRGKAYGFGRFTHGDPDRADVNETNVRPLDAEGALAYLRGRGDVVAGQIYLQGWSNGGSTALNVMIRQGNARKPARLSRRPRVLSGLRTDRPARIDHLDHGADRDVPRRRRRGGLAGDLPARRRPVAAGRQPIDVTLYPGATHDFDEPSSRRQSALGNQAAMDDALVKAAGILDGWKK